MHTASYYLAQCGTTTTISAERCTIYIIVVLQVFFC